MMNPGDYGFGGLLTLELDSLTRAHRFMEYLQNESGFGLMAVSLGYFDTLMSASAASTSSELTSTELSTAGIGAGLVRLSVGLTGSLEQRWSQLKEAYTWINSFDVESIHDVEMKMKKGKLQQPSWPVVSRDAQVPAAVATGIVAPASAGGASGTNTRGPSVPASDFSEGTDEEDAGDALLLVQPGRENMIE
jgi:hypothetical protein